MRIKDYIKTWPQYILPQHFLSKLMYYLTHSRCRLWKNLLINSFIRLYRIDMKQASRENANDYASFNDFFTRHLKPDARCFHLGDTNIISPVDGVISQIGKLDGRRIIQAKGKNYTLDRLLADDHDAVHALSDGVFSTLYLSPRDYHRIHMPCHGRLIRSIYVPGRLFGVGDATVRSVNYLFARNERFISLFKTASGLMAQIMVGAVCVSGMETVWSGPIIPTRRREKIRAEYQDNVISLKQGEEFGNFNMGSTIILIFEKNALNWAEHLKQGTRIQVGQILGKVNTGDHC